MILLLWTLSTSRSYQLVTAVSWRLELIYNTLNGTVCFSYAFQVKCWGFILVPGTEKSPATEIELNGSNINPFCSKRNKALTAIRTK